MKFHFRSKTKKAENDQIAHFRRRKRKRISVGFFLFDCLTRVTLAPQILRQNTPQVELIAISIVTIRSIWHKVCVRLFTF